MITTNFYLDKRNNSSEKSIKLYVRGLGKNITLKFNTGEKIAPEYWDSSKQQAKRNYIGHSEFNHYLSKVKDKVLSKYRLLCIENDQLSQEMIKKAIGEIFNFNKLVDNKKLFFQEFEHFISAKKIERRTGTVLKYKTLQGLLKDFEKKKHFQLAFDSMNQSFYEKFKDYLINDKLHSNNTIGKYISTLKTFLRWSIDQGSNNHYEFNKFKVDNEKTDIVFLEEHELLKIYNLDLSENKLLEKVRDVFCFQCYTGQRFSDIANLKREDIKDNTWHLHTYKTRDIIKIPLTPVALDILKKYEDQVYPLPVISLQKTNDFIKEVCKLAEINSLETKVMYRGKERIEIKKPKHELITTHTARRTFVTLSLLKGMKVDTIMKITGHTSYKTFRKYVKITDQVVHQEMNKYWKREPVLIAVNFK